MEDIVNAIVCKIEELRENKDHILIGIDGPCGAGKTSVARAVREKIGCPVIHMDDFYLSPEERTAERMNEPGGNVAYERFLVQVLEPLKRGEPASYKPYDCTTGTRLAQKVIGVAPVTVVEGSYSLHPALSPAYDLCVYLDVEPDEQRERLIKRGGVECIEAFETKWIPLEERYIEHCKPNEKSDLLFQT